MTAIDRMRDDHRRAQAAEVLEAALRGLCDLLLADDLEGEALYEAIAAQVEKGCDALDLFEHGDTSDHTDAPAAVPAAPATDQHEAGRRTCRGCGLDKPTTEYSRAGGGLLWTCKPCMREKNRAGAAKRKRRARESADSKEPV